MVQKTGRKPANESKKMQETLKDLFLQSGITPYQAAKKIGIDFKTAQNYFIKFAKELTDDPNHEDWFSREKRVRQRALEGYSTKIAEIRKRLDELRTILDDALKKNDHDRIEQYERMTRQNMVLLIDLQDRFDGLEMIPPSEAILEQELERRWQAFKECQFKMR